MHKIGIDIGSTYTKYCIMNEKNDITKLFSEKTPIRQKEYFEAKLDELTESYPSSNMCPADMERKIYRRLRT